MAPILLVAGAVAVVVGVALIAIPAAVITGGVLLMAGAVALAFVSERRAGRKP